MRALFLAAMLAATPALADEYPDPLPCSHRITTAYVAGNDLACHLSFGRKGHVDRRSCAPKRTWIVDGKMQVSGMGEVSGWLTLSERGRQFRATVRGWLSFSGNLTLAMQRDGDWRIDGLMGTARIRPTCGGMETVFDWDES